MQQTLSEGEMILHDNDDYYAKPTQTWNRVISSEE